MLSGEEMRAGKWTAIESHKITAFKLCRIERRNQKRGIVTQWGMETAASSLVRRNWEMLMATRFRKSWVFCTRSRRTMSTIRFPRLSAENPLTTDCAHSVSTTRLQEWITCIQSNFLTRTIKEKGTYQSLSSVISRKEPRVRHPCRVAVRSKPWAYAGTCDLAHHISDRMRELPKTNSSATGEPSYGYHGIITFTRSPRIPKVEIVLIVCGSLYWGLMNDKHLNDTSKLVRWHPTDQNSAKTGLDPSALARMAMHGVRQLIWPLEI